MGAADLIGLVVLLCLYFIPAGIAHSRRHRSAGAVFALNLLLGWTLLGWVLALVWSLTGNVEPEPSLAPGLPTPQTHVKCPDCAELVRAEARVCRHCGCKLIPQAL